MSHETAKRICELAAEYDRDLEVTEDMIQDTMTRGADAVAFLMELMEEK